MNILLIYPYCLEARSQDNDTRVVPMGLYYVGALLKANGYHVEILNWYAIDRTPQKVSETLREKKPDVIGFSVLHANRWGAIDIARVAKALNPSVKIVFGGIGASFLWKHFLSHFKEIDYCVVGEGEYPFLALVRQMEKEAGCLPEKIQGVAYRKKDDVVLNDPGPFVEDLDGLPVPAEHFVYQHVSLTRGCPGNCRFCGSPRFWERRVRFHSPDYFVRQLELLYAKGVRFFYFSDDTFTQKKEIVVDVCKKIIQRQLKIAWAAISRVDFVDDEMLVWMRRAGCTQISFGVESGDEKIRRFLNKNIRPDQVKKAFFLTRRCGILPRAYFIYGSPGENQETIQATMDLVHEIEPLSVIFYILTIFPGTALYADYKNKHQVTDDIWLERREDILYFETDPDLTQEMVLDFGRRLRSDFYEHLPGFVESLRLIEDKAMDRLHADFYSRLAMTFSHGDYAGTEAIKSKAAIAESLYRRALDYTPDHRAFLGLAIADQQRKDFNGSIRMLKQGLSYFPESEALNVCMGVSHMNLGRFRKALSFFFKYADSEPVSSYIAACYQALGNHEGSVSKIRSLIDEFKD